MSPLPAVNSKRIVIAGGSGFIGRALAAAFCARDFEVVVLTRRSGAGTLPVSCPDGVGQGDGDAAGQKYTRRMPVPLRAEAWNGVGPGAWTALLDGAAAVINLTGKNINCPHTPGNLREITASRVNSVSAIATAIQQARIPPRVWVQASAVGFYGDTADTVCDETAPVGSDPLANICRQWEGAFALADPGRTRKVAFRIGLVLGRDGGALPVMSRMTRWFLGGAAGSGRQYISWIHLEDLAAMFMAATTNEDLSGVFNAVSPRTATNAQFMRELRRAWHRPWSPPMPAFIVKLGARLTGSEGSLALVSQRCVPKRFLAAGFQFRFADLSAALDDLIRHPAT